MVCNGPKWFEMIPNDPKRSELVKHGPKWFQIVPNSQKGTKYSQIVPDDLSRPK